MQKNFLLLFLLADIIISFSCKKEAGYSLDPGIPTVIDTTSSDSAFKDAFVITHFGAVGDGATLNTTAIQTAIDSAHAQGGGGVLVPKGNFICGPITLYSHIDLYIKTGAILTLRNDIANYPAKDGSYLNFISASNATDIKISGSGTIDGQGSLWWTAFENNALPDDRPQLVYFSNCSNIRITDIHTLNPPNTHFTLRNCIHVVFDSVTIKASDTSHNTDGINFEGTDILIEHCNIQTGDDNIAFSEGGGKTKDARVIDCHFGSGHGISIGSFTKYGLDSLTVDSCTFDGTKNGIRLKSERDRGGLVQNLSYTNITMKNIKRYPILINSYYPTPSQQPQNDTTAAVTSTTPIWKNIMFKNITISNSDRSMFISGLPEMPVENVLFENVNISASQSMQIYYAKDINFKNCNINISETPELKTYKTDVSGL